MLEEFENLQKQFMKINIFFIKFGHYLKMYCKSCTKRYVLDLRRDGSVYFRCKNCGFDEDAPLALYVYKVAKNITGTFFGGEWQK